MEAGITWYRSEIAANQAYGPGQLSFPGRWGEIARPTHKLKGFHQDLQELLDHHVN